MLEMDGGRIGFGDVLRPNAGYELDFAVGTTYSLDLKALLGICLPLGLGFEAESLDAANPVSLFASLANLRDKVAIYCDKGGMRADVAGLGDAKGLYMLLEGMVHQVHVNFRSKDGLSTFHPKVWVAEYKPTKGAPKGAGRHFRLLVMSRNLTFDTSWDVVAALEGRPGKGDSCSKNVARFLEFLADGDSRTRTDRDDTRKRGSHTARLRRLAESVRSVEWDVRAPFDDVQFLPFGLAGEGSGLLDARKSYLMCEPWRNMLVMSPFLSDAKDSLLTRLAENRSGSTGRFVLLSREDSLASLSEDMRGAYECYCPVPSLADVELDGEGDADASQYSNLHAKLYFGQHPRAGRWLYLGSLNASRNGVFNNVEALLALRVKPYGLTFEDLLKTVTGEGGEGSAPFSPFVERPAAEGEDAERREFDRAFRIAVRLVSLAGVRVERDGDVARMDVRLDVASAPKVCEGLSLTMWPLLAGKTSAVALGSHAAKRELAFGGLSPEVVSAFFVVCGRDDAGHEATCVTVCPHDKFDDGELPLDERRSLLLQRIVAGRGDALRQYLAHAFDLPEAAYAVNQTKAHGKGAAATRVDIVPPGLYERLLDAVEDKSAVFDRASRLMDLIPRDAHREDLDALRDMVDTFSEAVGHGR